MSVLARVNFVSQQRVDLHHILAMESFTAADFRAIVTAFVGNNQTYIARGLKVVSKNGLTVGIRVANSLVFNPLDGNASFYIGLSDDPDVTVDLPADQTNIFVEGVFSNVTQAPVNSGLWDPLSIAGEDASGQEFTASVDTQNIVQLEISVNTTGFSEGAIPLFRASTSASAVTDFVDSRNLIFRLATGGANPDPLNKYEWSSTRTEPVPSGVGVGEAIDSPWRSIDSAGSLNDKAFESFKDWMDAVMTRISEISGSAIWYQSAGAGGTGISLQQLFFDSVGHSIQPSKNAAFKWTNVGGALKLISEGVIPLNVDTSQYHNGLIKWKANNTGLQWELGGTFANNTPGGKRNYTSTGLRFESPAVVDGGNIYLFLEREVAKGSGNNVDWGNAGTSAFSSQESVTGSPGDFEGIALGDYIRKESGSFTEYFKVVKFWDGTNVFNNTLAAEENLIADSTIVTLELQSVTDPDNTNISATNEPLRYFRSRYSSTDVVADTVLGSNGVVFGFQDSNFYWLGRRDGDLFFLRDYGTMQEGEEATTLDVVYAHGSSGDAGDGLVLNHAKEAIYNNVNGYSLKTGGPAGTLITIRRRKRDNTVETSTGDNSGAMLEYTIGAPVGFLTDGQGLWVRLSDTTGGALSAGSVTNSTDDENNTDSSANRYEILDAAGAPTRTFDNKDVFLLARRTVIGAKAVLIFCDGTIIDDWGQSIESNLDVTGNVRLSDYSDTAIPFIKQDGTKELFQDVDNFFYNDDTNTFGLHNLRWTANQLAQATPENYHLFQNLGAHTLSIGTSKSTTRILGDLIVEGDRIIANVTQFQTEDKLATINVGGGLDSGFGGGLEIADNTQIATQVDSTVLQAYVDITYGVAHGYVLGDRIGVAATEDVGGITAGQISGEYVVVATGAAAGDAEVISTTVLRVWTSGTATATATANTTPPKTFIAEWWMRVSDAEGNYATGDITSWSFKVKGETTVPTLTPVTDYAIVPTAHGTNFLATRIPFANDDNEGPSGVDSTLNFTGDFTWNDNTKELQVNGDIIANGLLRAQGAFRLEATQTITADTVLTATSCFAEVNTSAAIADISITLPPSDASTVGQVIILKDVGGQLNVTNKQALLIPDGTDTLIGDELHVSGSPFVWNIEYSSITLRSNGVGEWHMMIGTSGSGTASIRVDLYDPVSTTLPTGSSATIDGVAIADGDLVFFSNLSLDNFQVYEVSGVGSSIIWTEQRIFADRKLTPDDGEEVHIQRGNLFADQTALFNGTDVRINDTLRFFDGANGTDFWELGSIKTSTLVDNTVDGLVFSVGVTGSENWIISYSVIRASGEKAAGQLYMTTDGTTVSVADSNAYLSDIGVTFDADIDTGDIRLLYTTTSTGTDATIKFFTHRWSDSPGGPSGVPNYPATGGTSTLAAGTTGDVQFKGSSGNLEADAQFKWDSSEKAINLNGMLFEALKGPLTVLDNQATPVDLVSWPDSYKFFIIDYSLIRGSDSRVGSILITHTGTVDTISDNFTETAPIGVVFSADLSGGVIKLRYTSTSTGSTGDFKYSLKRWL